MATTTLVLRRVPVPLVEALVDLALAQDRDPLAQAERLIREGLERSGYWPPATPLNDKTARSDQDRMVIGAS